MKKYSITNLVLRGIPAEELVQNLTNLNPTEWQLERLINGVPEIDEEKLSNYLKSKGYILEGYEMKSPLESLNCVCVRYKLTNSIYVPNQPEVERLYDNHTLATKEHPDYKTCKTEVYKFPVRYLNSNWDNVSPEKFAKD